MRLQLLAAALSAPLVAAILPVDVPQCLAFASAHGAVTLLAPGQTTRLPPILTSAADWPGVRRAAADLATDFQRTTGAKLPVQNLTVAGTGAAMAASVKAPTAIIVGTIGMSPEIDALIAAGKIDVSSVKGQWEAFALQHVSAPLAGISDALVIAGADKRGSIFGLYTLSEQLGVSPWWFWTDTAFTQRRNGVFIPAGADCSAGSPTVQYRGIFLNDEQPALTNWANEKLRPAGSNLPTFRSNFYELIFELILRSKANFLWPAIWNSMFAVDDPLDQPTADMFGVVMGTSHQEPMMRSTPNEFNLYYPGQNWDFNTNAANITQYWTDGTTRAKPFESVFTMGMRGNGDLPLGPTTNIALLENIIATQRQILTNVFNTTELTTIPQVWCLYKEVQNYYTMGMRVPDDITLLWTDDNWGHIQRLPSDSERDRWGGAGVYFHADYVGGPRDYKWINTVNNMQSFQQLSLAVEYNATRVWVLNVGDLKGIEIPTDFFLSMAYNASAFNANNVVDYQARWAAREFGSTELAPQIATIVQNFTRLTQMRKPELVDPNTFSLVNYREADTIYAQWDSVMSAAKAVAAKVPAAAQSAFFETVLHPVTATGNLHQLYINAGRNQLFASRASSSANEYAAMAEQMFDTDIALRDQFHTMLDGKWNHMMDQTHFGYAYWQQPMQDTMPLMSSVFTGAPALGGTMRIAVENSLGSWPGDNMNDCANGYSCPDPTLLALSPFGPQSRFVDVSPSGSKSFTFNTTNSTPWIVVSGGSGTLGPNALPQRVELAVDWTKFPTAGGMQSGVVRFMSSAGDSVGVTVQAIKTAPAAGFHGFVEGDGVVSMEAAHPTRNNAVGGVAFSAVPGFGTRAFAAMTPHPGLAQTFTAGSGPSMEFDFFTFNTESNGAAMALNVTSHLFPSFNLLADGPCTFGISLDGGAVQTVQPIPNILSGQYTPPDWDTPTGVTANSIRTTSVVFPNVAAGKHTLTVSMITPGLVFEKFVVNVGGLQTSYLGPPESTVV